MDLSVLAQTNEPSLPGVVPSTRSNLFLAVSTGLTTSIVIFVRYRNIPLRVLSYYGTRCGVVVFYPDV